MSESPHRHSFLRFSHVLLLGSAMLLAACASDTPTSPDMDRTSSLDMKSGAASMTSDLETDGFRVREIDPSDIEYNGEDGPFEHVIRAPNGIELVFRFSGKIRAREEVSVTLRAKSRGQAVEGVVDVDFGDGRKVKEFDVLRTAELTHTYRQEGRYRIFAVLETNDGESARGGFRIAIDEPLRVSLTGTVDGNAQPGDETRIFFNASPMNSRARPKAVHGELNIDWGDGEEDTFVKNFEGEVARTHVYKREGTYKVKLKLTTDGREFTNSFKVEVANTNGLDPRSVTYLHANIANWRETSEITNVNITPGQQICIRHTQSGRWPVPTSLGVEGNVWVFAKINGRWYGATWEWVRSGQVCKGIENEFPRHATPYPMSGWRPKPGELVGFAMSTHARNTVRTIDQRSNIVLVRWPGK